LLDIYILLIKKT